VTRPGPYLFAGEERLGGAIYFCQPCANELVRVWQEATKGDGAQPPQADGAAAVDTATCPQCGRTYTGRLAQYNLERHVAKCTGEGA